MVRGAQQEDFLAAPISMSLVCHDSRKAIDSTFWDLQEYHTYALDTSQALYAQAAAGPE